MKKLLFVTIIALAALFASCAKKSASQSKAMDAFRETADATSAFTGTGYNPEAPAKAENAKQSTQPLNRKIIFNGTISLEVESLEQTQAAVQKWVRDFGGYISQSYMDGTSANFTTKIPSSSFDVAMEQASGFGKILHKNIESTDVTDEFYDLQTRIETKKVLVERLQSYLKNANSVKDMMEIETRVNEVTSDLETMQGQMNRLAGKIDFATVTITVNLPPKKIEEYYKVPDAKEKAKNLFCGLLTFLVDLFFILLYIILYGAPIVLVIAL
ncbi:MAG: DUF4349 domain-containing protein, partial [Treponema sp.]|nr:DUF4349 domain-containing protein [Treponema sp.]